MTVCVVEPKRSSLYLKSNDFHKFGCVKSHLDCILLSGGLEAQILLFLGSLLFHLMKGKIEKTIQRPFPNQGGDSEEYFSKLFFRIMDWTANIEQSKFFEEKGNFQVFTVDFNGSNWLLW